MKSNLTLGFPRMHVEPGERRDFTPALLERLSRHTGITFLLEQGYGAKLGFLQEDYLSVCDRVVFCDGDTAMGADVVTIIRTPDNDRLRLMGRGAILFSMLHYPTHLPRTALLLEKGIRGVSMDGLVDDFGIRYIRDFEGTARNALRQGLERWVHQQESLPGTPVRVTILGTGGLGRVAADAAVHYAGLSLKGAPPVVVTMAGRNVTAHEKLMRKIFSTTNLLVDTTLRIKTDRCIIPNEWLVDLPESSVIVDITADDYDTTVEPLQMKGIEGIPTGNLDKTVFPIDDPAWEDLPKQVNSAVRRTVVSCYSWPGADPLECVKKYEMQMLPFLDLMIETQEEIFDPKSPNPFVRALAGASAEAFLSQNCQ
jgi:alanine dehydrogenase